MAIEPGQRVGLVGFSGSGKSTFVNLILRHFEPQSGQILIDGQDILHATQDSLHEQVSLIPQDPSLFHRSLRENIGYGRWTPIWPRSPRPPAWRMPTHLSMPCRRVTNL
ncbi:ATP-binding cassette domain-containing protein [Methylomonas koyamae]|uniref:ATP-binding cassette domain-containing protein n=1 Tax=Methylomonas koyamae TaxID=702114 RepID=UPI003570F9C9